MHHPAVHLKAIALTVLSAGLTAQGDFAFDKTSPGTFGGTLKLDYTSAPASKPMMFMLSTNGGPTPLKLLFGGTDTRSLQVGVDLISAWLLLGTTPSGNGGFNLGVPNMAALQGLHLHFQLMTGGGPGPNIVDKISNKIVVVPGAAGTADILQTKLGDGRNPVGPGRGMMSVFPIKGQNGNVMLAGGGTGNILGAKGLKTTEIYDLRTMTSGPGPDMLNPRALHTATVLKDGRVLIAGGVDAGSATSAGNSVNTCEIYDPATNTYTATGSMGVARAGHAATLLNDGRVLVVAGNKDLSDVIKALNGMLKTCEIYNPTTGTWSSTSSVAEKVIGPSLTTLANGQVLVAGGARVNFFIGIPIGVVSVTRCQLWNPSSGTWTNTGSMKQHRSVHTFNTIRLLDGRVFIAGGVVVNISLPATTFAGAKSTDKCEYYNPTSGTWVALPNMSASRLSHTVNEMPNGRVLIAGGATGSIDASISIISVQEFNPATNTFVGTFNMKAARATHGSARMPDGTLIVFGGTASATAPVTLRSLEILHQ